MRETGKQFEPKDQETEDLKNNNYALENLIKIFSTVPRKAVDEFLKKIFG